jgi:hypothetical protein
MMNFYSFKCPWPKSLILACGRKCAKEEFSIYFIVSLVVQCCYHHSWAVVWQYLQSNLGSRGLCPLHWMLSFGLRVLLLWVCSCPFSHVYLGSNFLPSFHHQFLTFYFALCFQSKDNAVFFGWILEDFPDFKLYIS